jgi:hypothetical protein
MTSKEFVSLARAFIAIEDKKVQQKVLSLVRALSDDKSASPSGLEDHAHQMS